MNRHSNALGGVDGTSIAGIRVEHGGGDLWIVGLHGEHDLTTASMLDEYLRQVHSHGTRVVLDFSQAAFIDSSIISRVYREATHDATTQGSALAVVAPTGSRPRRILDVVQAGNVVQIAEDRADAIALLRPRSAG